MRKGGGVGSLVIAATQTSEGGSETLPYFKSRR